MYLQSRGLAKLNFQSVGGHCPVLGSTSSGTRWSSPVGWQSVHMHCTLRGISQFWLLYSKTRKGSSPHLLACGFRFCLGADLTARDGSSRGSTSRAGGWSIATVLCFGRLPPGQSRPCPLPPGLCLIPPRSSSRLRALSRSWDAKPRGITWLRGRHEQIYLNWLCFKQNWFDVYLHSGFRNIS